MMSVALDDPTTILHVLNYKASLPVLVSFFFSDTPRPASVKWVQHRTGIKARKTVNESLEFLEYLGVIARVMTSGKGWWTLTDKGRQLPLPFVGSLAAGAQPLPAPGRVTILDRESEASSQLPLLRLAQAAESRPSTQSADAVPMVANSDLDASGLPMVSKFYSPPLNNVVVILKQSDPDQSCLEKQQQEAAGVSKIYPPQPTSSPTAVFLREIGMGEPVPTDFCDFPLQVALAYWWYALAQGMDSPLGFLRRRLEQGHADPPDEYMQVAGLWLDLGDEERADLWDATTNSQLHGGIYLPEDFEHYVPFRPLLRLGAAWRKNQAKHGDWVFVPDCLAWEEDDEREDSEAG